MRIQSPRGTDDILPGEVHRWQHLEKVFTNLVRVYGYEEIRTPTFEDTSLFSRSVGETSDIVTKEMYVFEDKGGRSLTLKPEGTAGAMRALIQHSLCPPGHLSRLYYLTSIFRYERPQKGRMREAHQVGLELIGSPAALADAEVIEVTAKFYELLGFRDVIVSLNSIGRADCRARFTQEILVKLSGFISDQEPEFRARIERNPLRLLDSKDQGVQAALSDVRPITDFLEDSSKEHFEALQLRLAHRKVNFRVVPTIVRGLDYYTDTVFEVVSDNLGAQNSLCGGGRYDNLVKELGGSPTPSVGVAMGIERALIALEEMKVRVERDRPQFFAVAATPDALPVLERLADQLRPMGHPVVFDLESRNMKGQLKQAARCMARYALIIGEEELAQNRITVRNLDTSSQTSVDTESLLQNPGNLD